LKQRGIPAIQVNARLSRRAAEGWARVPTLAKSVFASLSLVLAQSEADAQRFTVLGATNVVATGNLKLALPSLAFDQAALDTLKGNLKDRPCWLAASIHPGEDEIVAHAHRWVKQTFPRACVIVVPRHPGRGKAMAETFTSLGLTYALRSTGQSAGPDCDVYIADTLGELGLFYRLCPVVFMGKSFAVGGGQNPAEPAQIGCALVWGPVMSNFEDLAAMLQARGAAVALTQPNDLARTIVALINDRERAARMAAVGQAVIAENARALSTTLQQLDPYLKCLAIE
jgi:3-deoxy-D-manno-octulosonic-acid transferase